MKKIFSIIKKDIQLRFASPVEWLFFVILPIVFILVLSGGTGGSQNQRVQLDVVDLAQSDLSQSLIDNLEESSSVKPILTKLKDAVSDYESQLVSAVLILPEGFTTTALKEGEAEIEFRQQSNDPDALIAQQAVQAAVERLSSLVEIANKSVAQAEAVDAFESEGERQAYMAAAIESAKDLMEDSPQRKIIVEGKTEDSDGYDPRANSTAGQMITWVFIPLISLSAVFTEERERGTLHRLMVTPVSRALYIGSTILGQMLIAVLQMVILIVFGASVLNVDWGNSLLALGLVILSSTLAAAALGTMLGTFVKTSGQAHGLSLMLGMAMALMGGCWYPLELFPEVVRSVVKVLPTTWAMQGFLDILLRGQGVAGILQETLVLSGFALVFFIIGVWRFKYD